MTDLSRRTFLRGAALIVASPAIVRFSSLMPVRAVVVTRVVEPLPYVLTDAAFRDDMADALAYARYDEFLYGRSILSVWRDEQNRINGVYRRYLDVVRVSDDLLVED